MRINQLKVLNKDEIKSIHDSSIELLEILGVKVESDEAIKLLKEQGTTVDDKGKSTFVKFIKRGLKGISVTEETLALDQIRKVATEKKTI